MTMKTVSPTDKLKRVKAKSKKKEAKGKKELRIVSVPDSLQPKVRELCELSFLAAQLTPLISSRQGAVATEFFNLWTEELWKNRRLPENFNVFLPKLDENGKSTGLEDTKCQFQVKFRTTGINKKSPQFDDLNEEVGEDDPEVTVEEALIETLMSGVVGMSEDNARKFVAEEITVADEVTLAKSLDVMLGCDKGSVLRGIGDKLIDYMQKRPGKSGTNVSIRSFTEAEEEAALVTNQVVSLKDGLLDRVFTYCESLDELRKLILWLEVTRQVSNYDFAIADTPTERFNRLDAAVSRYLMPDED